MSTEISSNPYGPEFKAPAEPTSEEAEVTQEYDSTGIHQIKIERKRAISSAKGAATRAKKRAEKKPNSDPQAEYNRVFEEKLPEYICNRVAEVLPVDPNDDPERQLEIEEQRAYWEALLSIEDDEKFNQELENLTNSTSENDDEKPKEEAKSEETKQKPEQVNKTEKKKSKKEEPFNGIKPDQRDKLEAFKASLSGKPVSSEQHQKPTEQKPSEPNPKGNAAKHNQSDNSPNNTDTQASVERSPRHTGIPKIERDVSKAVEFISQAVIAGFTVQDLADIRQQVKTTAAERGIEKIEKIKEIALASAYESFNSKRRIKPNTLKPHDKRYKERQAFIESVIYLSLIRSDATFDRYTQFSDSEFTSDEAIEDVKQTIIENIAEERRAANFAAVDKLVELGLPFSVMNEARKEKGQNKLGFRDREKLLKIVKDLVHREFIKQEEESDQEYENRLRPVYENMMRLLAVSASKEPEHMGALKKYYKDSEEKNLGEENNQEGEPNNESISVTDTEKDETEGESHETAGESSTDHESDSAEADNNDLSEHLRGDTPFEAINSIDAAELKKLEDEGKRYNYAHLNADAVMRIAGESMDDYRNRIARIKLYQQLSFAMADENADKFDAYQNSQIHKSSTESTDGSDSTDTVDTTEATADDSESTEAGESSDDTQEADSQTSKEDDEPLLGKFEGEKSDEDDETSASTARRGGNRLGVKYLKAKHWMSERYSKMVQKDRENLKKKQEGVTDPSERAAIEKKHKRKNVAKGIGIAAVGALAVYGGMKLGAEIFGNDTNETLNGNIDFDTQNKIDDFQNQLEDQQELMDRSMDRADNLQERLQEQRDLLNEIEADADVQQNTIDNQQERIESLNERIDSLQDNDGGGGSEGFSGNDNANESGNGGANGPNASSELFRGTGGSTVLSEQGLSDVKDWLNDRHPRVKSGDTIWSYSEQYLKGRGISNPSDYQIDAIKDQLKPVLKKQGVADQNGELLRGVRIRV